MYRIIKTSSKYPIRDCSTCHDTDLGPACDFCHIDEQQYKTLPKRFHSETGAYHYIKNTLGYEPDTMIETGNGDGYMMFSVLDADANFEPDDSDFDKELAAIEDAPPPEFLRFTPDMIDMRILSNPVAVYTAIEKGAEIEAYDTFICELLD